MQYLYCQKEKGFTLLEVILSFWIILIGLVAILSLLFVIFSSFNVSVHKIIAANLAQEGIEVVRNIRDSNWLQGKVWNEGLSAGDYRVQYNSQSLLPYSDTPLRRDSTGLYSYDFGNNTIFYRKITIIDNPDNDINTEDIGVRAVVFWKDHGKERSLQVEDRLYNWQ